MSNEDEAEDARDRRLAMLTSVDDHERHRKPNMMATPLGWNCDPADGA